MNHWIKIKMLFAVILGLLVSCKGGFGCQNSLYRTPDGSCNNVWRQNWGSAGSPYLHLTSGVEVVQGDVELLVNGVEATYKPSHHPHVNALAGIWADYIYKDLSQPVPSDMGLIDIQSSYLDGSGFYGTNQTQQDLIRGPNGTLSFHACTQCHKNSGLGSLYLVLFNEHNRLAESLSSLNPHWSSDHLFQESRKILTAEIQHITYNEFIPLILGKVGWNGKNQRFYNGYSSSIQAGIFYEAALTLFHFLPTMIPDSFASSTKKFNSTNEEEMKNLFDLITAALNMPAQIPSLHFNPNNGYMTAVNLLRLSRANTMASYTTVVNYCTGEKIEDFNQLSAINVGNQKWLSALYHRVSEVDLLLGALLERIPHGAVLGPTFQCILEKQFSLLRDGDRFWYENDLPPTSFSKGQLQELRKVTLSSLFCENIKGLRSVQPKSFIQEDPYLNSGVSCDHQTLFDLGPWKETVMNTLEDKFDQEDAMVLTPELIKNAIKRASEDLARRQRQEYLIYTNQGIVDPKSPFGTAAAFSKPNMMALNMANNSLLYEYASMELASVVKSQTRRRRQLDHDNVINFAPEFPVKDLFGGIDVDGLVPIKFDDPECHEEKGPCDPRTPYRSFTGHCNNLDRPNLGKSLTTFARLLPSVYENGISEPRLLSLTGAKLPSPRLVSSMIHADISHLHTRYTLMLMQFAQFVDHDITFTPNHRGFFSSIPDCRSCDSPITVHPECMPIPVPLNDPFYPQLNVTTGERMCLPFMRSLPGQQRLGSREQINQNSAYLDGSQIYGEHACMARDLRGFGGRLNVTIHPSRGLKDLLPVSPVHPECKAPSGYCFIAGDGRASEQPGLTALHTLYMREHNRLVEGLRSLNPHWSDEKLYQTARKINTAAYQHVTYNEFLPRLLGWNAINLYGLKLQNHGYYKGYSASCNPNVVSEFATAAYRIGHSLLRPHIPRMSPAYTPVDPPILLRDAFFNPDIIYQPHIIDEIMRGLTSTPMESLDQFITGEISNHLFEDRRVPHSGMDLPAMNIQRGRDHGIPPYNEYRALCNLKRATNWDDLSREIPGEVIARLRLIYPTVDDIDLFPGGLSERPLQGGLVGPTFACIIGLQFRQLRKCDRFWYESGDPLVKFTERQLGEIRKATLSKLICDNLDTPSEIQRSAFEQPSDFLNPRVWCRGHASIDLTAWSEEAQPGCKIGGRIVPIGESALPTPCTSCICTSHGGECASLRVTDCVRLLREAGRDAVLRDEVCAAQCASHLLDIGPPPPLDEIVSLTTRRPSRSREFPPPRRPRPPSLRKIVSELFLG